MFSTQNHNTKQQKRPSAASIAFSDFPWVPIAGGVNQRVRHDLQAVPPCWQLASLVVTLTCTLQGELTLCHHGLCPDRPHSAFTLSPFLPPYSRHPQNTAPQFWPPWHTEHDTLHGEDWEGLEASYLGHLCPFSSFSLLMRARKN